LFDPDIEVEDVGTPGDLSPDEYMEILPIRIEEVPNSQESRERRTKMQHDCRTSDEEEEEQNDEEEEEDDDGNKESNVGQDEDEDQDKGKDNDEDEDNDEDKDEDNDEDKEGEENNNDEDKLSSESDVLPLKLKPRKRHRLDSDIPATDREVTEQCPSAHQSLLDISGMQREATAEANPSVDSNIAMGRYLAPGTMALQAVDNDRANPDSLQMDIERVRSIQEQFDDSDGPMDFILEQKLPSSETMEISPSHVSHSQEGASPENVYQYEFPNDAPINPGGELTSFNGAEVALFGMTHRMDESFWHHPLYACHKYGSGDDTPRHDMGEPEERGEDSLDVMVVPTVMGAIIPQAQCSISLIVPKAEPINRPLCLMQYKVGGSFEDAITIGSDSMDDELNLTPVVEEVPTTAIVEGAEKKVSPEEYLDIQLKQLQKTKCARDDALVAENQYLWQLAREHGIVLPTPFAAVASTSQPFTTSQQATTSMDSTLTVTNPMEEDIVRKTQVCYSNL
jgi:hypothetical protein